MMQVLKRGLTIALALMTLTAVAAGAAVAARPEVYMKPDGLFSSGWTYALNGYDPVSYFHSSGPQPGSDNFTYMWKGAMWRFATKDDMDTFVEMPAAFAPQYGGYCAWAVAQGRLEPGDPTVWAIHHGKLYLNCNRIIKRKWDKDRDGFIARADANWPGLLRK